MIEMSFNNNHSMPVGSKGIINNQITGKFFYEDFSEKIDERAKDL